MNVVYFHLSCQAEPENVSQKWDPRVTRGRPSGFGARRQTRATPLGPLLEKSVHASLAERAATGTFCVCPARNSVTHTHTHSHTHTLLSLWLLGCSPRQVSRLRNMGALVQERNTRPPNATCPPYLRTFTATYRTCETPLTVHCCKYQSPLHEDKASPVLKPYRHRAPFRSACCMQESRISRRRDDANS